VAVRVIALAGDKSDALLDAARELASRTVRRYGVRVELLKPGKRTRAADDEKVREDEGRRLLEASSGCTRIALDAGGKLLDTPSFARELERKLAQGRDVAFLLGGATGHSPELLRAADETWSLSPLTFAHRLALLVVVEQVYRAGEISRGGPYAK
jgi:23S rRNA (pseudouridine1915-N3)-methyltransferase